MKNAFRRLVRRLDDVEVRRKLVASYLLGFLVPLVAASVALGGMTADRIRKDSQRQVQAVVEVVRGQLVGNFQNVLQLVDLLHADDVVRTTLDERRVSKLGHLVQYRGRFDHYVGTFVGGYPFVDNIAFYTENPAIIQGERIVLLRPQTQFAPQVPQFDGRRTILVAYMAEHLVEPRQQLSFFRDMTSSAGAGTTILRVDLSLEEISTTMSRGTAAGETLLVDEDGRILASSGTVGTRIEPFRTLPAPYEYSASLGSGYPLAGLRVVGRLPTTYPWPEMRRFLYTTIGIGAACALFASLIQLTVGYSLTHRLRLLTNSIESIEPDQFPRIEDPPGNDELGATIRAYNAMTSMITQLLRDVYEEGMQVNQLALEKQHAELEALYSKIDPHFLSNSLNTIRMLSIDRGELRTADALKSLSRLFCYLTRWNDETITVREEIAFIEDYLRLQQYRFGDKYRYRIHATDEVLEWSIPRMCIQPIVENASVHGIEQDYDRGVIEVSFVVDESGLVVTVRDDGVGMDAETLSRIRRSLSAELRTRKNIGLQNVSNRLRLIYADRASLSIDSTQEKGTTVRIVIPETADATVAHTPR